ncbi:hypothetical protein GUI12_00145 [Anaplasmataceae bacterium AB001_6]|nr:hypothetical protein GUI12_00145 [Anaplasmataceae bacterium AB001_6]
MSEDEKRLMERKQIKENNKSLSREAGKFGVKSKLDHGKFNNQGYKGLYDGEINLDIAKRKGVKKEKILDYMNSEELSINNFRVSQTDAQLREDRKKGLYGKEYANKVHYKKGEMIREMVVTKPEKLPTPRKSVKTIEKEQKYKKVTQ